MWLPHKTQDKNNLPGTGCFPRNKQGTTGQGRLLEATKLLSDPLLLLQASGVGFLYRLALLLNISFYRFARLALLSARVLESFLPRDSSPKQNSQALMKVLACFLDAGHLWVVSVVLWFQKALLISLDR